MGANAVHHCNVKLTRTLTKILSFFISVQSSVNKVNLLSGAYDTGKTFRFQPVTSSYLDDTVLVLHIYCRNKEQRMISLRTVSGMYYLGMLSYYHYRKFTSVPVPSWQGHPK